MKEEPLDFSQDGFDVSDGVRFELEAETATTPQGMAPDGRTNAEVACVAELSEFQVAARKVEQSMAQENDGAYYACVVFPSKAHRTAFFASIAVPLDGWMADGMRVAAAVHIALPPVVPNKKFRSGKVWAALPAVRRL